MGLFSKPKEFNINEIDMLRHRIAVLEQNQQLQDDINIGDAIKIGGYEIRCYRAEEAIRLLFGSYRENQISMLLTKKDMKDLIKFLSK